MAATPFLLKLPDMSVLPARTLRDNVAAMVLNANSESDARAFAKAQFPNDVDTMWDRAEALTPVAATDLAGWKFRVRIVSPTGAVVVDETVDADDNATAATKATSTLTTSANPTDTQTVTIGSKTYTFQDTLTNTDGHVKIGADETATLVNLKNAINASGGTPGTDYAAATTANADVAATASNAHTVSIQALVAGSAGNSIALSDTLTGTDGFSAMTGGAEATADVDGLANGMVTALNATSTIAGADYTTGTLTLADSSDVLGDHRVFAYFIPAGADEDELIGVPGFVSSVTDDGDPSDALEIDLDTDHVVPKVTALLGELVP